MQNLPSAETYEAEMKYMPWGNLIDKVLGLSAKHLPQGGSVVDLMCGTGHLIGRLSRTRSDLRCFGIDLEAEYIDYALHQYPRVMFERADVMSWNPWRTFDAVLCTGGLHHIHWGLQSEFIAKLRSLMKPGGFAIVADPYICDYSNEEERKINAAALGYEYLCATIKNGAPDDVVKAAADLIPNDVMGVEYKTSIYKIEEFFETNFRQVNLYHTWPNEQVSYGDYYFFCRL